MKNRPLLFIATLFIFLSCTTNENDFLENDKTSVIQNNQSKENETLEVMSTFEDSPEIETTSLNEIIVKYKLGISEESKETIREESGVVSFRTCDCTNNGGQLYELWIMGDNVDMEPTVKVIKKKTKDEVDFVAPNTGYNLPMYMVSSESENTSEEVFIESTFNQDYLNRIVPSNNGITIAVLDTGIDTDQVGFSGQFLYNSSQNANCNEESGWDFVNNDKNTYDDDPFKHGTVISYIIHNQLNMRSVDHQILPVKIANSNAEATIFNTLCGLQYAIHKGSHVINMSFGWESTNTDIYNIFSDLIDTTDAILVTSAGNKSRDNDDIAHYPSNFPQNHVLAVASAKFDLSNAAGYSNFGANTVDFYAIGNKISFPLRIPNAVINFRGTSFAAPNISARVAELLSNNFQDMRTELTQQFGVPINYLNKPVFYMKVIE